ncbi:hypothetical protein FIBSPDRAFT_344837 [Athelia psychrophila]|uniref:Uncharacterized protein n=1 Tax=Athelia psychrophila TaxID=1759441 RepID=A0A167W3H5_9AGAM|nr:hypothetical protein FIBSPDRAFT_344837 [Fibularhizoctonia sp. CBS 109695]
MRTTGGSIMRISTLCALSLLPLSIVLPARYALLLDSSPMSRPACADSPPHFFLLAIVLHISFNFLIRSPKLAPIHFAVP